MNILKVTLFMLLSASAIIHAENEKPQTNLNTTQSLATGIAFIAGSWLITKAIIKGYEFGMKEYLLQNSLDNICTQAKKNIKKVNNVISTEINLEHNTDFLNTLRSKYSGELFPLYYANELIIKMKNEITLDKSLLESKIVRVSEKNENLITAENLIIKLTEIEKKLIDMQKFITNSYEYKTERNELKNLHYTIANHNINHIHSCY